MRIFIGLTEVSGYFHRLKTGFDELGIEAEHVTLQPHRFSYTEQRHLPIIIRFAQGAVKKRTAAINTGKNKIATCWLIPAMATRILLFVWALIKFDVFILGAGSSFFAFRELPILRFFKKKVIYTLHGTDSRPPYIDGFFDPTQYGLKENETELDKIKAYLTVARYRQLRMRYLEKHVHAVVCGPSYAQYLSKPFLSLYSIGIAMDIHSADKLLNKHINSTGKVRILHAPSQLVGKGTKQIREVIQNLLDKDLPIEYIEITGKQNSEVLKEIAASDIVVDQFYSDTPMAALAAEAAMLGKPAVVGGYYSKHYKNEIAQDVLPPSVFCLPEEVQHRIEELVLNQHLRLELGKQARFFVEKNWSTKAVAARFLQAFESIPSEWQISPQNCQYLEGIGLDRNQVRKNIANIIKNYGITGLQLSHKPYLQQRYEAFSKEKPL